MAKWAATAVFVCCLGSLAWAWYAGNFGIVLLSLAATVSGVLAWDEWRK